MRCSIKFSNFFQLVANPSGKLILFEDCIKRAVPFLLGHPLLVLHTLHLLLLDLDQLLLHRSIVGGIHRAGESSEAFLLQNIIHLPMLAPNVEEQGMLLLENVIAQRAPEAIHESCILLLQLLHEVSAAVLFQQLYASLLLTADFAFQVIVAWG